MGPGLAFFTVAEAMGLFGDAQNVMSVLFYVMLFTLGLVRLVLTFIHSHPIIIVNFDLTQQQINICVLLLGFGLRLD